MKRIAPIFVGSLVASCIASVAGAGVYVETVSNNLKTNSSQLAQKMYVQNGSGRFEDPEGRASIIKGETIYVIDQKEKSYIVLDKATMEQLGKQLSAAMEKVKEQLAKMPPEQRAQMEQMMGIQGSGEGGGEWKVEAIDTGKSDKVEGRSCKVWDVKRNDQLDHQICVVPYGSLSGTEDFKAAFGKFARIFEDMARNLPQLSGAMSNEMAALSKVNGFPVRTRDYENGRLAPEEQVVKVWKEQAIPASMFEIPAGYTQKKMPGPPGQ
jgi:hypothetical protein